MFKGKQNSHFRAWKSGKKWLFATVAAFMLVAGGAGLSSKAEASSFLPSWLNSVFSHFTYGNDIKAMHKHYHSLSVAKASQKLLPFQSEQLMAEYQTVMKAHDDFENLVKDIKGYITSAKQDAAAIVQQKDLKSQQAALDKLKVSAKAYCEQVLGQTFKDKADAYQKALNQYNNFLKAHGIKSNTNRKSNSVRSTTISLDKRVPLFATTLEPKAYNILNQSYQSQINDYIADTQRIISTNILKTQLANDAESTAVVKAFNEAAQTLETAKTKLTSALADEAKGASRHNFKTDEEAQNALDSQKNLDTAVHDALGQYQSAYTTYLTAAENHANNMQRFSQTLAAEFKDDLAKQEAGFKETVKQVTQDVKANQNALASNVETAHYYINLTKTCENWDNQLTKQNSLLDKLRDQIAGFPQGTPTQEALTNWQKGYQEAVANLKSELPKSAELQAAVASGFAKAPKSLKDVVTISPSYHLMLIGTDAVKDAEAYLSDVETWVKDATDKYNQALTSDATFTVDSTDLTSRFYYDDAAFPLDQNLIPPAQGVAHQDMQAGQTFDLTQKTLSSFKGSIPKLEASFVNVPHIIGTLDVSKVAK